MTTAAEIDAASAEHSLVERILALVRDRTGTDFTLYRAPTVRRRIDNRMMSVGMATLSDYLAYLDANRDEAHSLLGRITIKVSRFYRNPATFDELRALVMPQLARCGGPLRLWSAGCGCGEEAYTLAMLLEDAGVEGSVCATDVDAEALRRAVSATYGPEAIEDLPCGLAARYLEPVAGASGIRYRVCERVRRRVRFLRHDITGRDDVPGAGTFDLAAFRNVAIYMKREVHPAVYGRVGAALRPGGYLFLGEAEWPPAALQASLDCLARGARLFRRQSAIRAAA